MNRPSSIEEFERQYAERAGVTVEYLHSIGRYGETCECGEDGCEGFAMGHQWEDAILEDARRNLELEYQRTPALREFRAKK